MHKKKKNKQEQHMLSNFVLVALCYAGLKIL